MKIYKLKPFFAQKLWGGDNFLKLGFNVDPNQKIGEAWVISAHENGMSYFLDGQFANQSLKDVFENNRNLFGNYQGDYPLLGKIISSTDYLSVQVHPDDEYAKIHNNSLGKPESWYVLDAPSDGELIYGHTANSKSELEQLVNDGQWKKLLKKVNVNKGDFLYVGAGKVHAITPNITVFELQRSSDVTYRFYDFDRIGDDGNPRRLDLVDSINVTTVPDSEDKIVRQGKDLIYSGNDFSLYSVNSDQQPVFDLTKLNEAPYWLQMIVIDGSGTINGVQFNKFDAAVGIGELENLTFTGKMQVLVSWIKK